IEMPEERVKLGKPRVGTVTMSAQNIGGEIVITIADDGAGLDTERILAKARKNGTLTKPESEYTEKEIFNMIMEAGLSTNEQVTEFSGRGVGMDVVRKNLESVGGSVSVDSKRGAGSTFTIKIPLTLAIMDAMELAVGEQIFMLPITSIRQSFKVTDESDVIVNTDGSEMILIRGECYPIVRLHSKYNIKTKCDKLEDGILIWVENDRSAVCLYVDELLGEQQMVAKPFPSYFGIYDLKGAGLSGCTILGDGSISLILDANCIINSVEK
ncbi:MAG: chemotaxis protein CheW, partial [Oscillospiraceae bacterium]